MATASSADVSLSDHREALSRASKASKVPRPQGGTQQQRVGACIRVLHARGWEQRLAPIAQHLADHGLVRAHGYDCPFARHLDTGVLRDALTTMLEEQPEDAYLIARLLIEEREPALVARELDVSPAALLEMSRNALDALGSFYEDAAFAALGQGGREQARAGKRSQ